MVKIGARFGLETGSFSESSLLSESSFDDDPAILNALEILSDQYVYGSTLDPSMN